MKEKGIGEFKELLIFQITENNRFKEITLKALLSIYYTYINNFTINLNKNTRNQKQANY